MSSSTTDSQENLLLTVAQVGGALQLSRPTIYGLIHSGQLRAIRFGKTFRIPRDAVDEFIRRASGLDGRDGQAQHEGYQGPRPMDDSELAATERSRHPSSPGRLRPIEGPDVA